MSAQPPFRQFQDAQAWRDASTRQPVGHGRVDDNASDVEGDDGPPQEDQAAWSYVRRSTDEGSASEMEVWPRTVRLGLIGVLALVSWALVLGAGHMVLVALR